MTQIVTNLLANATRYTPAGGRIAVAAAIDGGDAVISVRDTGIGIDPARLEEIFDRYVQAHAGAMGLGVGLTIVRKLAELHGGTVFARSEGLGRGSEFEVRFPLGSQSRPAAPRFEARTQIDAQPLRILVVDDEADIREMTESLLAGWGHVVVGVATGAHAVEYAVSAQPDLVLLDIGLPDMDGYEVATRVRAQLGDACPRIVAVTGYGQAEDRSRSEQAGIDQYLLKPPTREALQRAITKVARMPVRPPR